MFVAYLPATLFKFMYNNVFLDELRQYLYSCQGVATAVPPPTSEFKPIHLLTLFGTQKVIMSPSLGLVRFMFPVYRVRTKWL